jgi:hypothetical protein
LGNNKRHHRQNGKLRSHFLLLRDPDGDVIFLRTWWRAVLRQAAEILCRHQKQVENIRFALKVDGRPRELEEYEERDPATGKTRLMVRGYFFRHYRPDRFAKHEAFFPGDVVGLTCAVPSSISDQDFMELMSYAGEYVGISPARPGEFGFFKVESVRPKRGRRASTD